MKQKRTQKRTIAILLCMAFLMALLGGCGVDADRQEPVEGTVSEQQVEDGVYITLYLSSEMEEADAETSENDVETLDDLTTTMVAIVPEEALNAETIVSEYNQLVITSLYGDAVIINEVKEESNQVWVDFDSESVKALPFEEGTEGQLFYHMARSITDNLGDIDDVYLTMDGGHDFKLAHLWFEASRPFYSGAVPLEGE